MDCFAFLNGAESLRLLGGVEGRMVESFSAYEVSILCLDLERLTRQGKWSRP
jgi:hypothetical protein